MENTEEIIEQPVEQQEQEQSAIFLRKVDVIIQNGEDEEPIVIKAEPETKE
jgi:hypothetical protein